MSFRRVDCRAAILVFVCSLFPIALLLLLCLSPAFAGPSTEVVQANNRFAITLFNAVAKGGNACICPFGVNSSLAMLWTGATGSTASQIKAVLGVESSPQDVSRQFGLIIRTLTQERQGASVLRIANAIWSNPRAPLLKAFSDGLRDNFDAEAQSIDFSKPDAVATINGWVAKATGGKIDRLLDQLEKRTLCVLTNAVFLKAKWKLPFKKKGTQPRRFYTPTREMDVPTMTGQMDCPLALADGVQMLMLPYEDDLAMLVVLPDRRDGVDDVQASLEQRLAGLLADLKLQKVDVSLPRFSVNQNVDLVAVLKSLGMTAAFGGEATFAKMTSFALYVSQAVHVARVDVDEEGTVAAAATAIVGAPKDLSVARPAMPFVVDHPFLFLIVDRASGCILFIGRVEDPRLGEGS